MLVPANTIHVVAKLIELAGLAAVIIGGLFSIGRFIYNLSKDLPAYPTLRKDLGRSILLGLEFLVAGDIISTITIEPTLVSVAVLGLIVIIRTFLSFSLEVEINGRWPWQPENRSHVTKQPTSDQTNQRKTRDQALVTQPI